jgi:hypothetical protein
MINEDLVYEIGSFLRDQIKGKMLYWDAELIAYQGANGEDVELSINAEGLITKAMINTMPLYSDKPISLKDFKTRAKHIFLSINQAHQCGF